MAAASTVIKCRIYPTKEQEARLQSTLDICREIYNYFVFESRVAYKEGDDKLSHFEMSSTVPGLTKGKEIYSKVAQPVADRFFRNLSVLAALRKKKGRKVGSLRFKSKEQYRTFTYNQSGFKIIDDNKLLKLSKIGKIKINVHRKVAGKIKEVHIKRDKSDNWFAILVCGEQMFASQCSLKRERIVGIDVGINNFVYDSDGGVSENPSFLRRSEKKLAKAQRVLSRRTKGSANRMKQRRKLAKVHAKIANQRNIFLHRLSHYYVDKYDTIFVEDLRVENMKQNRKLSKSISDASWSTFFQMLEYKAARAGILFRKVTPQGTSQRCFSCGREVIKSLAIRTHCCPYCGLKVDRDYNASLNIKKLGMDSLPQGLRKVTPVEIEPLAIAAKGDSQARSLKQEAIGFNRW